MKKEYIIFDFDNTIVTSLDYWYKVMDKETFKHFGVKRIKDFRLKRRGLGNLEIIQLFLDMTHIQNVAIEDVLKFWHERMSVYYTKKIKLIKGVLPHLINLKNKGYKIILSSATNADLLQVAIKHHGLDKYFEHVYTEQILGVSKKYSDYYTRLLNELNTTADKVFVFEDSVASITK